MCISLPGHVERIVGNVAEVDLDGRLRKASLLLHPEVRAGDWVVVAAGTVVERLDRREAQFIRRQLRRAAEAERIQRT
jgi:hydrogenase expression/formation protein HypC